MIVELVRIHPRPPKNQRNNYAGFCFTRYPKFHLQGWIRTAAALSRKTAQKQPSATATTAASGRSREELLGLRPAGCACRPRHDAAAGSRDPGSFLFCAARDIHPRPPKNLNVSRCIPLFLFHLSLKAALPCRVTKKTPCDLSRSVFAFDA